MDDFQLRTPPKAIDIEKNVLGSCFLDQESLYVMLESLDKDDFFDPMHQQIFSAVQRLTNQLKQIDPLTVENELDDQHLFDEHEVSGVLAELTRSVSSVANTENYCDILRDVAQQRKLILVCRQTIDKAYEDDDSPIGFVEQGIFDIMSDQNISNTHESTSVIDDSLQQIMSMQESDDGITGIPTGLDIDKYTSGWQNGKFIVLSARPSMGKTSFVLQCLKRASRDHNVAIMSLETGYKSIGQRLLVNESGVDGQRLRKGMLSDDEISDLNNAALDLRDNNIIVDDSTNLTPSTLRSKMLYLKNKYDISLAAVDFLQLMKADNDNREQQVAEVSRTCKLLCKDLDIPIIALSQLNRGCEHRKGFNKRPKLSDIRESGAIEQDADLVISMFRPEYYGLMEYNQNEDKKWRGKSTSNICELIINKQKDGPTGKVRQIFLRDKLRFRNLSTMEKIKNESTPF